MPDLPRDITDPGTAQVPLANVESQAFGTGLATQVSNTVEDFVQTPASASVTNARGDESEAGRGVAAEFGQDAVAEQSTSATPATNRDGGAGKPGIGVPRDIESDQVAEQSTSVTPLTNVNGDSSRPGRAPSEVITNNIVQQVYGTGTPRNVNV